MIDGEGSGQDDGSKEFEAAFAEFADKQAPQVETEDAKEKPADAGGAEGETDDKGGGDAKDPAEGAAADPATDAKTPDTAAKAGDEPAQKNADKTKGKQDPWADVPANVRPQLDAVLHENRSNRSRMTALTAKLDRQDRELAEFRASKPKDAAKPASETDPKGEKGADKKGAKGDGKWSQFAQDYPEVAAPVAEELEAIKAENAAFKRRFERIDAQQQEADASLQEAKLLELEPDAPKIAGSKEFMAWVSTQPLYVQQVVRRNHSEITDAVEAADVIQRYRQTTGYGASPADTDPAGKKPGADNRRERQLNSAVEFQGKGPGAPSGPPDNFDQAFDHYAKKKATAR